MNLILTLLLVALVVAVYFFYAKFTRKGAVPLADAWKSFTVWLAAVGTVLGAYLVDLFAWAATQVDFLQSWLRSRKSFIWPRAFPSAFRSV